MKVLMVGATGRFAKQVLPELKWRGVEVRALVRSADKEAEVRKRGADEVAVGDLTNQESLVRAAEGVDGVFHIGPAFAPSEAAMGVEIVAAARLAGVPKFVFSGVMHPALMDLPNHAAKLPVEEAIFESGMTFTVLQPTAFLQNLEEEWRHVVQTERFALPYSKDVKASYVDFRDVAEAAAVALTETRLDNGVFELSAPGMFTRVEMAEMMSVALERPIVAEDIPFERWADLRRIPLGPVREGLRRMFAEYSEFGVPGGNALVARAVLGREPRTVDAYLGELAERRREMAA
jgi:uncharacterized protein YbjT (DUF2867 family)